MLDGHDWVSVHAFSHAGTGPLVAAVVAPQLRQWRTERRVRSSFYLNHWEGGPHVRVRVLPTDPREAGRLEQDLTGALRQHLAGRSAQAMLPEQYRLLVEQGQVLEGKTNAPPLQPDGAVVPWAYRPEWARFGGEPRAVSVVRVFGVSSALAGAVSEADWSAQRKVSLALQGALLTLRRITRSDQELLGVLSQAASFWSASLGEEGRSLEERMKERPLKEEASLRRWTAELLAGPAPRTHPFAQALADEIVRHLNDPGQAEQGADAAPMALDLLHLHHNRLGFSLWHEARLWLTLRHATHHTLKGERYVY